VLLLTQQWDIISSSWPMNRCWVDSLLSWQTNWV